jgi:thiosulfate/3-mercaptopyruvate sulfurtransferase
VDLDLDLAAPAGAGGRHPLPEADAFSATMRRLGASAASEIVVYDAGPGTVAARLWWLLRHGGHSRVRLLDGGLAAWVAAGLPVETGDDEPVAPGDLEAAWGGMPVVDAAAAEALARDGVLLDVRAPERYRGEIEPVDPVAGHIPGARSLPTTGNVGAAGTFLDSDALRERFAAAGASPDQAIAAYCGSGVNAAHTILALELAGLSGALYPGSWSEWVADADRPVATGPDPG